MAFGRTFSQPLKFKCLEDLDRKANDIKIDISKKVARKKALEKYWTFSTLNHLSLRLIDWFDTV